MEKKDKNIYVIIFAIIIGLALIATVVTYILGNNKSNSNEDKTEINSDQVTIKDFIVSPNNLYINKYNEMFNNYSRLTEVTYHNIQYYIEKGKLFKKSDDVVSEVDISGETAKFIAEGWSGCSGNELMILTEEGNIYSIDMDFNVSKKYDGGNAKEILFINNYVDVNSTCNRYLPLALIDNELYHINNDGTIFKEDRHEYVIYGDYILYSDGTMNAYKYNDRLKNLEVIDEVLIDQNNNKILVSFMFGTDKLYYIISSNGNIYSFPNKSSEVGVFKFQLTKVDSKIGKIKRVKVFSDNDFSINKIELFGNNSKSFDFKSSDDNKLYFVDDLYLNNTSSKNGKEYSDIEIDKENNLEYSDNGNTIKLNVYPAYDYESSKFIIYFNDKEIYNIVDFTTSVKVFKFNDIYVVEYKQDQSQCGNFIDILIDKNGTVIDIPGDSEKDTFNDGSNDLTPNLMKTEFDESTNKVVAYKKICSMCPSNTMQVGFKYTYLLKDNKLILQNKENLYCE